MTNMTEPGLTKIPAARSVDETVARITQVLTEKNITLFALVDHSGEAAKAGLHMPPTKLLIFGNPKGGTPLMLAAPSAAIDLPLKLLIAEDAEGKVWITYNSPAYLRARHQFPEELLSNIAGVEAIAKKAAS
jgi:uncharacterized protein (DUF302 family)